MDVSTNEKSTLRSLKSPSLTKRKTKALSPRDERRQKLKQEYQREQLKNLWRVIFLFTLSLGLGFLFIRSSQTEINSEKIHIKGANKLNPDSIINASGYFFPQKLITINPIDLKAILMKELPLQAIEIRKLIFPPIIEIELKERQPIAFASKQISTTNKKEGMVDENGFWMPIEIANLAQTPIHMIYIQGWMPGFEKPISTILKNRENLGSTLEKIILESNGEISLETKYFKRIHLGSKYENLNSQIKILGNLDNILPSLPNKNGARIFDLKDPQKPELQFANTRKKN